jgi:hypothetical protein
MPLAYSQAAPNNYEDIMKRSSAVGWIAGLALVLIAAPLRAQATVHGGVVVHSGPVGHAVGHSATVIIPEHKVIVVKRVHARRGWWKKQGHRVVTVYYDGRRYYRRHVDRPKLRRVMVYERGGRYYIDEDQWKRYRHHH